MSNIVGVRVPPSAPLLDPEIADLGSIARPAAGFGKSHFPVGFDSQRSGHMENAGMRLTYVTAPRALAGIADTSRERVLIDLGDFIAEVEAGAGNGAC
ncbi:MAG: hypothetical protein WAV72_21355 [Bradyrhizobium sp.]